MQFLAPKARQRVPRDATFPLATMAWWDGSDTETATLQPFDAVTAPDVPVAA